jgi:hypothetical protein
MSYPSVFVVCGVAVNVLENDHLLEDRVEDSGDGLRVRVDELGLGVRDGGGGPYANTSQMVHDQCTKKSGRQIQKSW